MWFRERPRTRSWAWDRVHVEAQNKDKVVGMGRGTHGSPRHLSCLLSRTYGTGYTSKCEDFVDAKRGCNFVNWESMGIIFKIRIFCVERIIFKIRIICIERKRICVEHHLMTRSSGVRWSWWLRWAKEQCRGSGYSSKPTKQGNGRAWRKGCGGAAKKGRWPGYSTRPTSSKESWPEALAEQARSLGLEHWPSKQGVSTRFISWAMNKSRPDGTTDKQMDTAYRTIFEQMKREPVTVPLKRIGDSWSK